MRSWLGWENPRMTCTLQLPGRDSEKRPEGFDKPQFYPAAGVAVQRCEQRARWRCEQRARSRSRSEWGASVRESAPAGDPKQCIRRLACKSRRRSRSEWGASDRESAPAGDVTPCIPEIACKEPALMAPSCARVSLTRPDSIRANPVPAESRDPPESAVDRSRASLEHRFPAACDSAPAHGSGMLPRRRLRGAIT